MKCAFIISPSYSGSTLLSMLLAHHPRLVTLGEFLDSRERRRFDGEGDFCSCGAELNACTYLETLVRKLNAEEMEFSVDYPNTAFNSADGLTDRILRAHVRAPWFENLRRVAIAVLPPVRHTVKDIVARNCRVISTLLAQEGAEVYLDSAKNNNRVLYFDRYAPDVDVKVIWLVRDGRGVTNSIMKHYEMALEPAIEYWKTEQRIVAETTRYLRPEQLFTLKYEALCAEPGRWLAAICAFLGLDVALLPETFGDQPLHLTGNNMRLRGIAEIRVDEKWKSMLTTSDLEIFTRRGGDLNRRLGYPR